MIYRFPKDSIQHEIPKLFTYPFHYTPDPLSALASTLLQQQLDQTLSKGKMYGVLVVKDSAGDLGYLVGYSGNRDSHSNRIDFVPPIFDLLDKDGFFLEEETKISAINSEISELKKDSRYNQLLMSRDIINELGEEKITEAKERIKQSRKTRREIRQKIDSSDPDYHIKIEQLSAESQREKIELKKIKIEHQQTVKPIEEEILKTTTKIDNLKKDRAKRSNDLQNRIFRSYIFLNNHQEKRDLLDIFETTPPAGAGDCAAPKLLNFAYSNGLTPISMAEFWWGESPKSEIRKQAQFYPSCSSKCKPILGHMLKGLNVAPNPLEEILSDQHKIKIIYEDKDLLVINKPHNLLSVPGKEVHNSVYSQVKDLYPEATGPMIVHRLDMSTSGLMIVTKSLECNKLMQKQFSDRSISKRYVALLEGSLDSDRGEIDLPIRVDLDNRPSQLVCFEHGKSAKTFWSRAATTDGTTRVNLYPVTGRTHQLRVHCAHKDGLNSPILGDELYGNSASRLYLHAEEIKFKHPITREEMIFKERAEF